MTFISKFVGMTAAGLVLLGAPSRAADPLSKYVIAPQAMNTTLGYENVEQSHSTRVINGEAVDIKPLFTWINRGKVQRGSKPFDQPSPLPAWKPIDGTVLKVMDGALLVAKGISRTPVIVKNVPRSAYEAGTGGAISVAAVEAGALDSIQGKVPIYDYGSPGREEGVATSTTESNASQKSPPIRVGPGKSTSSKSTKPGAKFISTGAPPSRDTGGPRTSPRSTPRR